jgi:ribosomal protein L19E
MTPTHEYLRWNAVVYWLTSEGFSRKDVVKLVKTGVIKGKPLFVGSRNYYFRSEIQRDVLDKHAHNTP